jgi:hypothetical protein
MSAQQVAFPTARTTAAALPCTTELTASTAIDHGVKSTRTKMYKSFLNFFFISELV